MPRLREPKALECTWRHERQAYGNGVRFVAGCDEAGRGALIGPLYAAAVILDPGRPVQGLDDSKKLSRRRRELLAEEITARAVAFEVVAVSAREVDELNVYEASRTAMLRALHALNPAPQFILTDAMRLWRKPAPPSGLAPFRWLIHGDARSVSIAAASILAKVARDAHMRQLDGIYPQYGLSRNKGYGAPDHLEALARFGPCPEHRKTFRPVSGFCLPLLDGLWRQT